MRKLACDVPECMAEVPEGFESRDWLVVAITAGRLSPRNPSIYLNFCSDSCLEAMMSKWGIERPRLEKRDGTW